LQSAHTSWTKWEEESKNSLFNKINHKGVIWCIIVYVNLIDLMALNGCSQWFTGERFVRALTLESTPKDLFLSWHNTITSFDICSQLQQIYKTCVVLLQIMYRSWTKHFIKTILVTKMTNLFGPNDAACIT